VAFIKRKSIVKIINRYYPVQVWLTSIVVIAPILTFIFLSIYERGTIYDNVWFATYQVLYSLVFSLPAFIIGYLLFSRMAKREFKYDKLVLIIINIFCAAITLYLFLGGRILPTLKLSGIYGLSIIISSMLFRIYRKVRDGEIV